ncbi:MAG: recombinase family protein [Oscillospiraceae bacterium]|nr:recombinase family protein [Oscillospiraceae bacterium]
MILEKTGSAYIRVSTEEQTELSPDSQLKEIRKYAKQNNIELLDEHIYIDAGISGRSTVKRPEFNKMIGAAKSTPKPFDVILLWKFSRFARNREDSIVYKSMLRKDGIEVISISESLGDDKTSILIEALIEAMDEYYSINLSGEVKRGMKEKAERGGVVSIPAFGYKIENGNYVTDEEKSRIIRFLFDEYLKGVGVRELAVRLNEKGILTSRGGVWENRTVEYILRNPVYIGKIRWNPERKTRRNYDDKDIMIAQGSHEPIIDEHIFNEAQKRLAKIKAAHKKGEHQGVLQSDFMLRGLVKCSNCGATLVQAVKGVSLQCHAYAHGKCPVSHSVVIHLITETVIEQIRKDVGIGTFLVSPVQKSTSDKDDSKELTERLRGKLSRVMDAYENGVYGIEEFKERKTKIEIEMKKMEERAKPNFATSADIGAQARKNSVSASLKILTNPKISETEKNLLLRQIVEKIIFNRGKNEISIYYL